jgi:hypothetical protein
VKIVSANGNVTLRGSVNTEAETVAIASKAKAIAGAGIVDNRLEVKTQSASAQRRKHGCHLVHRVVAIIPQERRCYGLRDVMDSFPIGRFTVGRIGSIAVTSAWTGA